MPETLPQYDGPLSPRMQFEELLGSLAHTAARIGTRAGRKYEEVDSWQSKAGHIAFTTTGRVFAESAEVVIRSPNATTCQIVLKHGDIEEDDVIPLNVTALSFVMNEPELAAKEALPAVQLVVDCDDGSFFDSNLSYEQFAQICESTGVYEQIPTPRRLRIWNWVLNHTIRRPAEPEGWGE